MRMHVKNKTSAKIIGDWGSLVAYAKDRGLSVQSLRQVIRGKGDSNPIMRQLIKDGYAQYLGQPVQNGMENTEEKKKGK